MRVTHDVGSNVCTRKPEILFNPRIALLIPKIPGLADNPRIEHAQTWNLLNPRIVLLVPKIPGLGMIIRFRLSSSS